MEWLGQGLVGEPIDLELADDLAPLTADDIAGLSELLAGVVYDEDGALEGPSEAEPTQLSESPPPASTGS